MAPNLWPASGAPERERESGEARRGRQSGGGELGGRRTDGQSVRAEEGVLAHRIVPGPRGDIEIGEVSESGVRPTDAADAAVNPKLRAHERRRVPLTRYGQRTRSGRTAGRRRVPSFSTRREHVHIVVSHDVVRAAKEDERVGGAREARSRPRLRSRPRRLRPRPRAPFRIEQVHGIGVGARVTAEDGEGGAGGGARDARGGVGRRARSRHARPRQAAHVQRVHVVVAPRARAD